jgi:hypothetical protein
MTIHLEIIPILSILTGVIILVVPRILNYAVAVYLIAIGVLGMVH